MISAADLKRKASTLGLPAEIVEKDYVIRWALWGIGSHAELSPHLVFKGGTALHVVHFDDWRFSEDLDFTTVGDPSFARIVKWLEEAWRSVKESSGPSIAPPREAGRWSKPDGSIGWMELKSEYVGPRAQLRHPRPILKLDLTWNEQLVGGYEFATTKQAY